ncbi:uncharacterized protein LOC106868641 [Octopus bimaculoides]|uniref:uncharacterized protein LOC106868641 n=1 Tax=Octopus bimaculoides TaxID=37653 RepID=UPI00071D6CCA|nr:uncharacterized protein LOC106868641 [Octopus bimaculoides]|eukprot:XP_014769488.1 PREDICTED: uncharacterized protein LOC106868641 [Octopus bimaculoides]
MRLDMDAEVSKRIRAGWKVINTKLDNTIRTRVFNSTILPALYVQARCELTKRIGHQLVTTQKAMRKPMIGISLREHIRNEIIRERSGVNNVIAEHRKRKFRCTGHVTRFTDDRWIRAVSEWYTRDQKRSLERLLR